MDFTIVQLLLIVDQTFSLFPGMNISFSNTQARRWNEVEVVLFCFPGLYNVFVNPCSLGRCLNAFLCQYVTWKVHTVFLPPSLTAKWIYLESRSRIQKRLLPCEERLRDANAVTLEITRPWQDLRESSRTNSVKLSHGQESLTPIIITNSSVHSSRMRTARLLTYPREGGVCIPGGVCPPSPQGGLPSGRGGLPQWGGGWADPLLPFCVQNDTQV